MPTHMQAINLQQHGSYVSLKEKEFVKPKEFAVCNFSSILRITQLLDLMKASEVKMSQTKLAIQQHKPVDIKPKSTNLIEPGEGFVSVHEPNPDIEQEDETMQMLEQLADRKFIVRRGRNNRILAKAIVKNIFEDT
jgi:hypothetical protein